MKKFVFAVALVLTMTGPSFAGFMYSVEPVTGFYDATLVAYLVRCGGAKTFTNINIWSDDLWVYPPVRCPVHQVNEFGGFPIKALKTLWLGMMSPEGERYDTHFMFAYDAVRLDIGNVANETSTKNSSPTGISQDEYGFYYGLGTFSSAATDGFTLPEVLPRGTPFMQIVVPRERSWFWLTGTTVVDGKNVDFRICPLLPEPGTIAMLIAGALSLVAFRFRRR